MPRVPNQQRVFRRVDPENYRVIAPKPVDMPIAISALATHMHPSAVGSESSATLIGSSPTQVELSAATATSTSKTTSPKSVRLRPAKRRRIGVSEPVQASKEIVENSRQLLINNAKLKILAETNFPLKLDDYTNYIAVEQFQSYIDAARASHQDVCASCGLFIAVGCKHVLKKRTNWFRMLSKPRCLRNNV